MAIMLTHSRPDDVPRRPWPAWALSIGLHSVMFVILALCLQTTPRPNAVPSTAERTVGIVLAVLPPSEHREEFSDESQATAGEASLGTALSAPDRSSASTDNSADGVASVEPPLLANLALPNRADARLHDSSLLGLTAQPRLRVSDVRGAVLPGLGDEVILAADVVEAQPAGPSGPPGQVSLFGSPAAVGHSFVFVIDRSNSMGDGGLGVLAAAEVELLKALAGLRVTHKFQIVAYNERASYFNESGLAPATEANRNAVRPFFDALAATGGTEHERALQAALRLKPDVIFLFTDGGDPHLNTSQLAQLAARAGSATSIHCLQFGRGPLPEKDNFMMRLADRTRGSYGYIDMNQTRRSPK